MNAPFLAPLAPCPDPNTAARIAKAQLSDADLDWHAGLADLESDPDEPFTRPCDPLGLPDAQWLAVSPQAAACLDLDAQAITESPAWLDLLSGNAAPAHVQPYAAVYAGHQFGNFVPRLGDGRALNLGSLKGWELQLKGAGPTPYSRFADGRAVLRSSIREFLCSEAMYALGIPTTRALSLVISPAPVIRETVETAAVVCRMAPHFVRFGNFEYFAAQNRPDLIERLLRWVAPSLNLDADQAVGDLSSQVLHEVSVRTARLMADWMRVGFMHGVMNTDNFSILGLTLDYGPFGFMDGFNAQHICNHTDHSGRYSYQAQPQVGLWNITRLASALNVLVKNPEKLAPALDAYRDEYERAITSALRAKFGLQGLDQDRWSALLDDFYGLLHAQRMDYTQTFRALATEDDQPLLDLAVDREAVKPWLLRYRAAIRDCLASSGQTPAQRHAAMNRVNPKFVLRNWVAEDVIRAVRDHGDTEPFAQVFEVLQHPFDEHPDHARYAGPPPDWAHHLEVSCSS
jgi:serine/tyrosine/threonine adenylyltransferase